MRSLNLRKTFLVLFALMIVVMFLPACGTGGDQGSKTDDRSQGKTTIVFADADWDSMKFHNWVARLIVEHGYGYQTEDTPGSTQITFTALRKGDIDVYMEVWTDNLPFYDDAIKEGNILELSTNFGDNNQALYVPTYVVKGDPERGIEPMAPGLKTVKDLLNYKEVFPDPEDKSKGIIYGSISGWAIDEILYKKYEAYGLNEAYNYMRPGSEAALSASISAAYEKGEPWVGYYWEPTWIMGKYDMTLLEDEEYSADKFEEGLCEFPSVNVAVCVHKSLVETAPELVEFLKNYKTSSALTSDALAYMMESGADHQETAKWFLRNKEDVWVKWVPENVAEKVKAAVK